MTERHPQTEEARRKIGASVGASVWRRRARDKSQELQSAVGQWDEDYQTPSRNHHAARVLWEECHGFYND